MGAEKLRRAAWELIVEELSKKTGSIKQIEADTGVPRSDVQRLLVSREPLETISLDRYLAIMAALGVDLGSFTFVPCEPVIVKKRRGANLATDRKNRARELADAGVAQDVILMGLDSESMKAAGVNPVG